MIFQISPPCLPNVGEALAALLGVSLASQLYIDQFILEGDSKVVVSALQHPQISKDRRISNSISDILGSISRASFWEAKKVNRSANFCAHYVARLGRSQIFSSSIPFSSLSLSSIPLDSAKYPLSPVVLLSLKVLIK